MGKQVGSPIPPVPPRRTAPRDRDPSSSRRRGPEVEGASLGQRGRSAGPGAPAGARRPRPRGPCQCWTACRGRSGRRAPPPGVCSREPAPGASGPSDRPVLPPAHPSREASRAADRSTEYRRFVATYGREVTGNPAGADSHLSEDRRQHQRHQDLPAAGARTDLSPAGLPPRRRLPRARPSPGRDVA